MGRYLLLLALMAGCEMYFDGSDDPGPDAAVVAEPDAAECEPSLPSCSEVCAAASEPLDCPWPEQSAPCACAEPTGLIHYCTR